MSRLPQSRIQLQVIDENKKPIGDAVVEIIGGGDVTRFAQTDTKGMAFFNEIGRGVLRVIAHADGFVSSQIQIAEDARASIQIVMKAR